MPATRIYLVTIPSEAPQFARRLVRAANKSQAVRHVADSIITAEVASQDALIAGMRAHLDIEDAGEEAEAKAAE